MVLSVLDENILYMLISDIVLCFYWVIKQLWAVVVDIDCFCDFFFSL